MNTIYMPGFSAKASLYKTSSRYRSGTLHLVSDSQVHPASCYSNCDNPCAADCRGLTGNTLGACLRACRAECLEFCGLQPPRAHHCAINQTACGDSCCPPGHICCGDSTFSFC